MNSLRGGELATAVAKHYGERPEVLVFLRKEARKTVQIVKNYGGSKLLRLRAPYYFTTEGSFGNCSISEAQIFAGKRSLSQETAEFSRNLFVSFRLSLFNIRPLYSPGVRAEPQIQKVVPKACCC